MPEPLDTSADVNTMLMNARVVWTERARQHRERAARIRDEAIDQAARILGAPEAVARTQTMIYQTAERSAAAELALAARWAQRVKIAEDRGLVLNDGSPEFQVEFSGLFTAAQAAGRLLNEAAPGEQIMFFGDDAPADWKEQVRKRTPMPDPERLAALAEQAKTGRSWGEMDRPQQR